jgi:acyl-CoA thioesterase FadM
VTTVAIDAFNVLNHVNYVAFVGDLSSQFFGHAVAALPTRRVQATLRFKF